MSGRKSVIVQVVNH